MVTYGVRGHTGNFSFLTPRAQSHHHRWQCSSHLTALHSIASRELDAASAETVKRLDFYDELNWTELHQLLIDARMLRPAAAAATSATAP